MSLIKRIKSAITPVFYKSGKSATGNSWYFPQKPKSWKVVGDHPISLRPDKFGLTKEEAEIYAAHLKENNFENVEIIPVYEEITL